MRQILLRKRTTQQNEPIRLARLTRHLHARLLDFGPTGPKVSNVNEDTGTILAHFPQRNSVDIMTQLQDKCGVLVDIEDDSLKFILSSDIRFEDLDYVWGCLFELE